MAVTRTWYNQRSFLIETYNEEVENWFSDLSAEDIANETPRAQAFRSCLILSNDSQNMTLIKMNTFRYVVQKSHLKPDVYGIAIEPYQEDITFRPQIHLFFLQDLAAVTTGRRRIEGQISFRLVNETSETMTDAKAREWAEKINNSFAQNNGFIWSKGKVSISCKDPEVGLNAKVYATSEETGLQLIDKVYELFNKDRDDNLIRIVVPKRNSETNPTETNLVYEKQRKKRRWRPTANVRFQYALLTIHGMQHKITLVDRTRSHLNALIWA